ncbi:hypothetical protein AMATHDRAFT_48580 [Amanita thiersii Skay4041]|uniref:Uncharacterized protein n=1 Tax=Amanita thiersii Skay4041 TaxID=703135 RepID=A0A2A9NJV1_9AGAR|nr:hypothetical protein AMATHDRAFT_48580 [Amanita thiersii Skay4041]
MDVIVLKEVLKTARSELTDVFISDLALWKSSIPIVSGTTAENVIPVGDVLCSVLSSKEIFPVTPQQNHIHILVQYPNYREFALITAYPWAVKRISNLGRRLDHVPKGQKHSCLENLCTELPTSVSAPKSQGNRKITDRSACCHPQRNVVIPITLLDHVFAKLDDDMQNLQPIQEDHSFALELGDQMSQHDTDETRIATLCDLFKKHGLTLCHQKEGLTAMAPVGDYYPL